MDETPMACTRYVTAVQELVDAPLGPIRLADLESHLETCADCRELRADLERIREAARGLGGGGVPDRAGLQIAGRLRQEGRIRDLPPAPRGMRPGRLTILALAATLILAVGASLVLL